jgi:hypothetical protein
MTEIPINEAAVNEIVDYLKSGKLFSGISDRKAIRAIPCRIVESLDPDELYRYRDPDAENAMIQFPMNWNDIVADAGQNSWRVISDTSSQDFSDFSGRIQSVLEESWSKYKHAMELRLETLVAGELYAMIDTLIRHRAVCGIIQGHLYESLWHILKLGGFPCGWYGGQDGMLAVYVPPVDSGSGGQRV